MSRSGCEISLIEPWSPGTDGFRTILAARMFDAINGMMLHVLAAVARQDYEDRRRRQAQGQAKAKAEGRYKGRKENVARNDGIASMLKGGISWSKIQAATGCSRATIAKIAKRDGPDVRMADGY